MERFPNPAPDGPNAEVRHATVLKCDLVGSTRTKKQLDLDGQLAFKRRFEQVVTDVATHYSAHIGRFEGDGALVVLGFPQPREDAAESAVRMGLDLIDAIRHGGIVPNVQLQLRVGIASGLIAVVKWPSSPSGESVAGLTIDMAERLRTLADPDQVIIADSTKRLASGFFRYDDLGTVPLKGFDEGIRAWRVAGPSLVVSRFEAQRFGEFRGEIIGRADELARLFEAWLSARGGRGQAVCVVGDAGIGKSRLAQAGLDAAVRDGAAVLRIDCTPSTGNTPLFPFGVLLRRSANITPNCSEDGKQALARQLLTRLLPGDDIPSALAYLAPLFGLDSVAIPANVGPADVHNQTISIITRMFSSLAAEQPVAMLCEDLHWADDSTTRVLARVCEEVPRLSALVIVTFRASADDPPLDLSTFTTIGLEPLDPYTAADLVRSVACGEALPAEMVSHIVDRCEGVPLVIQEVTRNMLEAATNDDAGTATAMGGEVPAPLQLVIQSRLGRWPQFAPIVQLAAVLGREFSIGLLQMMAPADWRANVIDMIDALAREGLFARPVSNQPDRARFKHVMICEAVYNTLLGTDKQRLHSAVADILCRDYNGMPDAAPDVIAEHLRKARRFVEAVRLRLAESARTAARGAYVETEGHCLAALALVDEIKDLAERTALRFRLLIQMGVALTGQRGYSAAAVEDVYRRAQAECGDSVEAEMLYPIMRALATVNLVRGNLAAAYDLSLRALKLAEQSERVEFRVDAMSVLCYTTLYFGRLHDCRLWIERCMRLYRAEQGERLTYPVPHDAGTAAIALLPTVVWLTGDAQGAEDAVRDGLAHVDHLNRDFDKALMHSWVAGTRFTQRRYVQALEHAAIAVRISQQHGYREWYGTGALLALLAQSAMQADPQAVAQATAACMEFAREGVGLNASYYFWGLALGYARAGDHQTARQMLAEAFTHAEASGETRMNAELLILQAELEADDVTATELLGRAYALADEQGAIAIALRAAAATVLRSKGDDAGAAFGRAVIDVLDGRSAYPTERDWMPQQSAALRRIIDARKPAVART